MPGFDKPVLFGKKAAERTRDAVIRVEREVYGGDPRRGRRPVLTGDGLQRAYTDGTISARVGTTPGTGGVFIVIYDGSVYQIQNGSGGNPTITQAVLNFSSTTGGIPSGTYCWIGLASDGQWEIISVDCGN